MDTFPERHPDVDFSDLKNKAIQALQRLLDDDSELNELWADNEELYPAWKQGIEALIFRLNKYLQENKCDIILMDLLMPELNGFEATKHIRSKMNSQIPIIALTADLTTVDVEKCKAVGMNDYLSKPVDEKLLYSKITKYVKKPIERYQFREKGKPEVTLLKVIGGKHDYPGDIDAHVEAWAFFKRQ